MRREKNRMEVQRGNLIGESWTAGNGPPLQSLDPASGDAAFSCNAADGGEIKEAVASARAAAELWQDVPFDERVAILNHFAYALGRHREKLATVISRETGKPMWEALTEVDAMVNKVAISVEAWHERRRPSEREQGGAKAATGYKPIGVMAVFGPFNMPGHLPNGHIIPALLAGNTVVFKPSELTPGVGVRMVQILRAVGVPCGVVNVVQGGRDVGGALAGQPGIDGVLFTGSVAGGLAIRRALVDQPGKILALEMGGNNPLIVWDAKGLDAAAFLT